jgi:phage shock protein PspC (stress-responsive transcriptional regulator)
MPDQSTGPSQQTRPSPGQNPASDRFFGWLRSLGLVRTNGWIGGVCGGVAARLGIDPIIVRGIAVVVAVLGGPAFLLYAAAWLLLPDAQGYIHLERLLRGHFDPPIIAIIVIALFSFLPFAQGFWWAGAQFWTGLSWFATVGRVMWTLLVIALIVGVIVWAARSGRVPPGTAPTTTQAPASQGTATDGGGTDTGTTDGVTAGVGGTGASPDDLADWRARQEAWKADYAAWTAQQNDARAVRQQRSAEIRAQAQALSAEAEAARRRRRAANPRTSASFVFIALGAAIVAAGIAGAIALNSSGADDALAIALAASAGVVGVAIVTAGILRRRSGFLTFVSIVLIVLTALAVAPPRNHALVALPSATYWNTGHLSVYQPVGSMQLYYDQPGTRAAEVVQGAGSISVQLQNGVSARVEVTQHSDGSTVRSLRYPKADGGDPVESTHASDGRTRTYLFGDGAPQIVVHIDQTVGSVFLESTPAR